MDWQTVASEIKQQGDLLEAFVKRNEAKTASLEKQITDVQVALNRPDMTRGGHTAAQPQGTSAPEMWRDVKSGQAVPVLEHKHSLAALEPKADKAPSLGRVLRGMVLGGRADDHAELADERKALNIGDDPAGGYTVAGALSAQWVDALRARMVLSRAGARTVPMDSKSLTLARVTADPTVSWHGENASITDTEPTFGAVTLNAKTCVALVKLSLELAQDSANIEQILQATLVNATANAIDSAGLNGVTTNAAAAPTGLFNLAGRSKATSIGAPTSWDFLVDAIYTLMASNVPMDQIGAFIAHPAVWKKMRKLKTGISSDNTSLVPPPEVAALPKLWTTAAPFTSGTTCSGIIADWSNLLFGVRKQINVRILSEAFMGSNLQVGVLCYARCDFVAARPEAFYTAEGITV